MSNLTSRKVLAYAVLPGFWPRICDFVSSGFGYLAFFIAVIYQNIGLLPRDHAYVNPQNFGRYGVRHVLFAASHNLVFDRQNLDRVIIFFTVLAGLILLLMQGILIIFSMVTGPVFALTWTQAFLLTAPLGPQQDVAMIVLDQVFGVRDIFSAGGFFGSCYSDTSLDCLDFRGIANSYPPTFPQPYHLALHSLFGFYSNGILIISCFVLFYFITAIVGETIATGTPFGQRFNKAWFIPRLIFFFAMIVPITTAARNPGINGAQYITLSAAKFGSNMATNAWVRFGNSLNAAYIAPDYPTLFGNKATLIAYPNVPSSAKLTQFMFLVRMCMYAERLMNNVAVRPYLVRETDTHPLKGTGFTPLVNILPFIDPTGSLLDYNDAVRFARNGSVVMRFGELNTSIDLTPGTHEREWGYVKPICGELVFDFVATDPYAIGGGGIAGVQELYYQSIREYLLYDPTFDKAAYCMVRAILPYDIDPECVDTGATHDFQSTMWSSHGNPGTFPSVTTNTEWATGPLVKNSINYYDAVNKSYINGNFTVGNTAYTGTTSSYFNSSAVGLLRANYDFGIPNVLLQRGWVGMSIYYRKIAEINGLLFAAVNTLPAVSKYPMVMEVIAQQHDAVDTKPNLDERFNPLLGNGKLADLPRAGDHYIAAALYSGYRLWQDDGLSEGFNKDKSNNIILDTINALFGTDGLFNMLNNNNVHPLAQLSALGRSMLEASIRNIFVGSSGMIIANILESKIGSMPKAASQFATRIGMIGISTGFMLFYVLPLLPFIYFFFAFGNWVKSIFEAMVAMPLWALAHIKIDGNGLPGPMGLNGYFLLFEIFLRPILIVFGFVASIQVFTVFVTALNRIYDDVVMTVTGYALMENMYKGPVLSPMGTPTMEMMRGPIDQLIYTIVYAVLVYMIALSCFKLIDQIPNALLRFMGSTVSTFTQRAGDPAGELMSRMSRTAQITRAQLNMAVDRIGDIGEGAGRDRVRDAMIQMGKQ